MTPVFTGIVAVLLLLGLLGRVLGQAGTKDLRRGLRKLGDPSGRTEQDFVDAFRLNPTSISAIGAGQRLLQWQSGGQHLAVQFDATHRYMQITHRHQV